MLNFQGVEFGASNNSSDLPFANVWSLSSEMWIHNQLHGAVLQRILFMPTRKPVPRTVGFFGGGMCFWHLTHRSHS